jgi:diguanylate cyclase (GGDEF)-like protein/PAS domain S-box-containing protein
MTSSNILGRNFAKAIKWTGDSLRIALEADTYVLEHKGTSHQYEMSFMHPDGKERFLAVTSHAGYDSKNYRKTLDGIVEDITERKAMEWLIKEQALSDQLTGLYNRHKINEVLSHEIDRSARYSSSLCVGILDIDHFKKVNDTYGHMNGDKALIAIATILKQHTRKSDIVGRWGGEEFIIISAHTNLEGMENIAEKIRKEIEEHQFGDMQSITASIGITQYFKNDTFHSLLTRADEALYEAKQSGRNKIIVRT